MSSNFMAAVTICSDLGAQENKVCHCFHCVPIYLSLSDGTRCLRNISNLRYVDDITLMAEKIRGTKVLLEESERGE